VSVYRMPVTVTGPQAGGPWVNVFHILTDSSTPAATTISQVVTTLRAFYTALSFSVPNIGPTLAGGMSINADFATDVDTQQQLPVTWPTMTTAATGGSAPTRLSLCVTWRSRVAARRATGRTFLPPLSQAVQGTDGLPKSQTIDQVKSAAAAVLTSGAGTSGGGLVVYGLVTPGGGPKDPHTAYALERAVVKQKFATLRTRG
jgi:hypothetical protein